MVWVGQAECRLIITLVVMGFFMESRQLVGPTLPAPPVQEGQEPAAVHMVTADNCWLSNMACIKGSKAAKRISELGTSCVYPAAKSKISLGENERHVKWSYSSGGYLYLQFDLRGVVAKEGDGEAWRVSCTQWAPEVSTYHTI